MPTTIFVRERRKIEKGEKKPRFRVVGLSGGETKLYAKHMRKVELDQIASTTGANIVYLPTGHGPKDGSGR
jgi:hypothetical protein